MKSEPELVELIAEVEGVEVTMAEKGFGTAWSSARPRAAASCRRIWKRFSTSSPNRGAALSADSIESPAPRVSPPLQRLNQMREKNPITHEEKLSYLRELREAAIHSASEEAVEKQHARGKLTARERIDLLLDPGSFQELDTFVRHRTYDFEMQKKRPWGDAVVTGHGTIEGRLFSFSPRTSRCSGGAWVR